MTTTFGDLERGIKQKELAEVLARLGRKYLVFSGKGGVGKTTLSVNLAWLLARSGQRVGLLDVDLNGPDLGAALYMDAQVVADESGRLMPIQVIPGLWILTVQHLLAEKNQAVMWRGPRKMRAIIQFLGETAWPELDYFIIDCPPGTGDETLSVIHHIKDITALVVTTGHSLAIADAYKAVSCLKSSNTDIKGLVENQASLVCPDCGRTIELNPPENVQSLARETALNVLTRLPLDPKAAKLAEKSQKPLVEASPDSPLSLLIKNLALTL
ncbi:MAG: Mrp/NBP35 family ATP-binding protein [Deltaproteobacteria bacterium]|jgi:Mrp family chromosome partitioning ATPase|nr:Mrp/NBP35 family ATP-binding protein [Deltaproteobacteria bacterium]